MFCESPGYEAERMAVVLNEAVSVYVTEQAPPESVHRPSVGVNAPVGLFDRTVTIPVGLVPVTVIVQAVKTPTWSVVLEHMIVREDDVFPVGTTTWIETVLTEARFWLSPE